MQSQRKASTLASHKPLLLSIIAVIVLLILFLAVYSGSVYRHLGMNNGTCNNESGERSDLSGTQLSKFNEYVRLCTPGVISRSSFFTSTPTTDIEAVAMANDVGVTLLQYKAAGVEPLVFLEPTHKGVNVDLNAYAHGAYDEALSTYYSRLQQLGIDSTAMGQWVILPEINLPEWSTSDPAIFGQVVTRTSHLQKRYFSTSKVSIMLDSQTFHDGSDDGRYTSWLPYTSSLATGVVDSVGLQGFPEPGSTNPTDYLRIDFLEQAASSLAVHDVWINTGTYATTYDASAKTMVAMGVTERQTLLAAVAVDAQALKNNGYHTAVHLFAQDKLDTPEKTDWSYWHNTPGKDANTRLFTAFATKLHQQGVALWVFDQ